MRYAALSAVLAVLLLGGGYYVLHAFPAHPALQAAAVQTLTITEDPQAAPGFPSAEESAPNDTVLTGPLAPARTPPAGYRAYRSEQYRFELFYPQALAVHAYDEGGGAATIVFESAVAAEGFQIFVTPYGARQVSAERFKKDEPSGVMGDPRGLEIDGVLATMFASSDAMLGETREVWFIRGGYLFEVTAPKSLDAFLARVMTTWKFI